ncbi:Phosphoglucomutase [Staphylococcus aureus]|nr:Phosphoglucomutase [Staphylococcus aureus]
MDKELWIERANDSLVKHFYEQQSDIEQREGFESKLTFGTAGTNKQSNNSHSL